MLARIKSRSWIHQPSVGVWTGGAGWTLPCAWHQRMLKSQCTWLRTWSCLLKFDHVFVIAAVSNQQSVWWLNSLAAMCLAEDEIWKACRSDHHCIWWVKHARWAGVWELCHPVFFHWVRPNMPKVLLREGGQGVHLFRGCFFLAQPQFCQSLHDSSNVACQGAFQMMLGAIKKGVVSIFKVLVLLLYMIWHWNIVNQCLAVCTPDCWWCVLSN